MSSAYTPTISVVLNFLNLRWHVLPWVLLLFFLFYFRIIEFAIFSRVGVCWIKFGVFFSNNCTVFYTSILSLYCFNRSILYFLLTYFRVGELTYFKQTYMIFVLFHLMQIFLIYNIFNQFIYLKCTCNRMIYNISLVFFLVWLWSSFLKSIMNTLIFFLIFKNIIH